MSNMLITGADGHFGSAIARWMLRNSDHDLVLFIRANDAASRATKLDKLGPLHSNSRCSIVFGDLREEAPLAAVDPRNITHILHSAAVTDFAVERETARAVNTLGTAKLLTFARQCKKLQRFGLVSTLYAAGLEEGPVEESPIASPARFANHYEWSKWEAEKLVCEEPDLPWHIYRLATIICEDNDGAVVQQNVIHNTLRLLYYGLLSVIPGDGDTRVYTCTTRFATEAVGNALSSKEAQLFCNISDNGSSAVRLGALTNAVYETFLQQPNFAQRRILPPLFCDLDSFRTLATGISQFGTAMSQAVGSVLPFAPQLYCDKDVRTANAQRFAGNYSTADPVKTIQAVSRQLARTRWGLRPPVTENRDAAA